MGKKRGSSSKSSRRDWEDECSSRPCTRPNSIVSIQCEAAVIPPGSGSSPPPFLKPNVETLLEDGEGYSMLVAGPVLSDSECDAWIQWGESQGFALEKHAQTSSIAHRDNGRLAIESHEVAHNLFARLQPWLPTEIGGKRACGCNPNIRVYKYEPGQRFGPHVDQANRLADGSVTEFTVLIYLSNVSEGGETVFYGSHGSNPSDADALRVQPRKGACLVHAHGVRCLTHEGAEVKKGVKYLLRTDVAFR